MLFRVIQYAAFGLAGGMIAGMGMGGGTLLIPLLTLFGSMGQKQAQGANLLAYLFSGALALWLHAREGRVEWAAAKPLCLWGALGAAAGAAIALWLESGVLRRVFGGFVIAMGLWQLFISFKADAGQGGR